MSLLNHPITPAVDVGEPSSYGIANWQSIGFSALYPRLGIVRLSSRLGITKQDHEASLDNHLSNSLSLSNPASAQRGFGEAPISTELRITNVEYPADATSVSDALHLASNTVAVFRFMDLPTELRNLMYAFFLSIPPGEEFQLDQPMMNWALGNNSSSVLKVSRTVYNEALPIFLMQNKFLLGSSIVNTGVFGQLGMDKCRHLQHLSIHLNGRTIDDCCKILNAMQHFCVGLRSLELRVSPSSPFLPHVASLLRSRTNPRISSGTNILLRLSIMKAESQVPDREAKARRKAVLDIGLGFQRDFKWPEILRRTHEITIKGTVYSAVSEKFETLQIEGWQMVKTMTTKIDGCETRESFVVRTWVGSSLIEEERNASVRTLPASAIVPGNAAVRLSTWTNAVSANDDDDSGDN